MRLRTGLLWPLVGSYGLLLATASLLDADGASDLARPVEDLLPAAGVSVLLAAYGLAAWPRDRRAGLVVARPSRQPSPAPSIPTGSTRSRPRGRADTTSTAAASSGL